MTMISPRRTPHLITPGWDGVEAVPDDIMSDVLAKTKAQASLNATLGLRAFRALKVVPNPGKSPASIVERRTLYASGEQDLAVALAEFINPAKLNDRWLQTNSEGLWREEGFRLITSGDLTLKVERIDMSPAIQMELLYQASERARAEARRARLFNLCDVEPDWMAVRSLEIIGQFLLSDGSSQACAQDMAEWFEIHAILDDARRIPLMQVDNLYDADQIAERMEQLSGAALVDNPNLARIDEFPDVAQRGAYEFSL